MRKIKDLFFAGVIFGGVGGLTTNLYVFILKILQVKTGTPWRDSTAMFFSPPEAFMFSAKVFGFLMSLNSPIAIGVMLCVLVKLTGKQHIYMKSIALAMGFTFFMFSVVYPFVGISYIKHSIVTNYVAFTAVIVFGGVLGHLINKYTEFN